MSWGTRLQAILEREAQKLISGRHAIKPPTELISRVGRLRRRCGNGVARVVTSERIREAALALKARGAAALTGQERFVLAYGLAQPLDALRGQSVIGSAVLAANVLELWEKHARLGRIRPATWRGLFRSFLQAAPGPAAERLRRLLKATLPGVREQARGEPSWLQTVQRHAGLLNDAPCTPYIEEIVHGRRQKLDDLIVSLAPPAPSWFWRALLDALFSQISRLSDAAFEQQIAFILGLADLSQLQGDRDEILARTLDRYAESNVRERHQALLDYALDAWKSPQLQSSVSWSRVAPDTKRMVCGWLALEDLEDFYRVCQGDREVDERRLKYWLRFKEQISFTQILLGRSLFWSRNPDVQRFRNRKHGRLGQLTGGTISNNAMLMRVGKLVFVEFSETGNACYPYREEHLPFKLGSSSYAVQSLRHLGAVSKSQTYRLIHHQSWEEVFDGALEGWGIRPDVRQQGRSGRWASTVSAQSGADRAGRPAWALGLSPGLVDLIIARQIKVEDLRANGGSLWVFSTPDSLGLHDWLITGGFKYKQGKGYFRE
jgi:hypothetical protein